MRSVDEDVGNSFHSVDDDVRNALLSNIILVAAGSVLLAAGHWLFVRQLAARHQRKFEGEAVRAKEGPPGLGRFAFPGAEVKFVLAWCVPLPR